MAKNTSMTDEYIDDLLDEFEKTVPGFAGSLRLDFADLVMTGLRRKGFTQARLSDEAGVQESTISRVIHAEGNSTFETVAKLLHALGVKPTLVERAPQVISSSPIYANGEKTFLDTSHGINLTALAEIGTEEIIRFTTTSGNRRALTA